MDFSFKSIIPTTAVPGLIGDVAGGLIGMLGQQKAVKEQKEQAREQMAFQERMSSTAHQREVEDLRKAGLNPILSANTGASSPSGAQADISNILEPLASSARRIGERSYEIRKLNQDLKASQIDINTKVITQKREIEAIRLLENQIEIAQANARKAGSEADIKEVIAKFVRDHPNLTQWAPIIKSLVGTGASAIDAVVPF